MCLNCHIFGDRWVTYRSVLIYSQYDPENSGFISTERFRDLLATHGSELDPHKLEVLLALADGNADGKICYQDFVNLVRYPLYMCIVNGCEHGKSSEF